MSSSATAAKRIRYAALKKTRQQSRCRDRRLKDQVREAVQDEDGGAEEEKREPDGWSDFQYDILGLLLDILEDSLYRQEHKEHVEKNTFHYCCPECRG